MTDEQSQKFADLMVQVMCKPCSKYKIDCKPEEVIACTNYFYDWLVKISEATANSGN